MDTMQQRGTERLVLAIGQITVSHHTVWTPSGSAPVNDVSWTIGEDAPLGVGPGAAPSGRGGAAEPVTLTVTVTGPGWQHIEDVGPARPEEVTAVRAKVTQARMLALRAVVWSLQRAVPLSASQGGRRARPAREVGSSPSWAPSVASTEPWEQIVRVVVMGAGGYVGSRLVPALLAAGHEVTATFTRRRLGRAASGGPSQVDVVEMDVLDRPVGAGRLRRGRGALLPRPRARRRRLRDQ